MNEQDIIYFAISYCLSNYDQLTELRQDDLEHQGETDIPTEEEFLRIQREIERS